MHCIFDTHHTNFRSRDLKSSRRDPTSVKYIYAISNVHNSMSLTSSDDRYDVRQNIWISKFSMFCFAIIFFFS